LRFLGLSLDSFRIAGGIILAILGIDMIHARKSVDENELNNIPHNYSMVISSAIIPVAIPLTTGAGTFSTIIILADSIGKNWSLYFQLIGAILLQTGFIFVIFRYSDSILRVLGRTGMSVLIRIVGLFTLALGVQFITSGLKVIFPRWGI
jgi:multiple antibiotic resistance protein